MRHAREGTAIGDIVKQNRYIAMLHQLCVDRLQPGLFPLIWLSNIQWKRHRHQVGMQTGKQGCREQTTMWRGNDHVGTRHRQRLQSRRQLHDQSRKLGIVATLWRCVLRTRKLDHCPGGGRTGEAG